MGQTRVLEIREEEKVWYDEESQAEHPFHRSDTVMQNDERRNSLEGISKTCTGTESGHKLLWNGFDVTDYSRFANGAAALKDQRCEGSARNSNLLVWEHNCCVQDAVGDYHEQAHVEKAQVMWCLDQVVSIEHASKDWHGLNSDEELCTLKVSIELYAQLR